MMIMTNKTKVSTILVTPWKLIGKSEASPISRIFLINQQCKARTEKYLRSLKDNAKSQFISELFIMNHAIKPHQAVITRSSVVCKNKKKAISKGVKGLLPVTV